MRQEAGAGPTFSITFPAQRSASALDGRLLLILAARDGSEPRDQVVNDARCAQIFGLDVDGWAAGSEREFDGAVFGFPLPSLRDIPAGDWYVQAVLNRYETFHRADGFTLKLPPDKGEGQQWSRKPGNLYSQPQRVHIDPRSGGRVALVLDQEIPPIEPAKDSPWVKHIKMKSERLSKFWGRPVEIGACVLVPAGFEQHPEARYPLVVFHGHFPATFNGIRETPPDPDLEPDFNERFQLAGYNRIQQEYAYDFFKAWTGPSMPRLLIVEIQHANPFYDDSYAVNSENLGPYGDAIQYELIPEIERRFRGIGSGWARFTYGGSTGGWEALAVQTFYPDEYNGCFAACPDPIDFRAYTVVDIYSQRNAYYDEGPFARVPRPGMRKGLDQVTMTVEQLNHLELVLGTKSRSGQQWDIWEAVFSPCGADGYPQRIWDKRTGVIDPKVATYWRDHYDLRYILQRDWATLGPKLAGKIHIYCGTMDNYFLNDAVYLMDDFLESAKPPFGGEVAYGERAEHCWNGDPTRPNATSRLRYNLMYVDKILKRIESTAPAGADLESWRY
ncbi:MAG: hypothetical protein EXS08_06450 [Planctomycetes bacterium]|nr:hypothetical protein [Planctomycetota bacterium]